MSSHRKRTVLVAGGSGFIGSHLCDRFLKEGYRILCLDNLQTGRTDNTAHLVNEPDFQFIQADIAEPIRINQKIDYVLNFASPASPVDFDPLSIEIMRAGAWGTYHLLELALCQNAVFMQASTSEVYGDPLVSPQPESYWGNVNPIGRRSVYDEAKRYAEALTMAFRRKYGIETRILRIFNTYGPRMRPDDGRAIPNFINQALKGDDITIHGDGSQTRSLCYVDDEVEGVYRLLMSNETEPVNIGNPDTEVTILKLAETIVRIAGSKSRLTFIENPHSDDPKRRCPDIARARKLLGWEPRVSLQEGLRHTVDYFSKLMRSTTEKPN